MSDVAATTDDVNFFKRKAREWALKVKEIIDTPVPESMAGEKAALINFARKIYSAITKIFGEMEELAPVQAQLGIIPFIVGAVALGTVAALIVKWTTDYNKFKEKLAEVRRLESGGMSPEQAAQVVRSTYDKSWLPDFGTIGKNALAVGAVGFGVWWFFFRKKRRG